VEHFYVKFGDPVASSVFEISCEKNRQSAVKSLPHDCRRRGHNMRSLG